MNNNRFRIYPSILTADLGKLENQIVTAEENGVDGFHIDVMDGQFVPPITFGPIIISHIRKITKLPIDIHMMVIDPHRFFDEFIDAGADVIVTNNFSARKVRLEQNKVENTFEYINKKAGELAVTSLNVESSVAINPNTSLTTVQSYLAEINQLLIMSVNPGYGGQKFIPSSINKIEAAKSLIDQLNLSTKIQVDGGINSNTISNVFTAGADIVVAGSAIYNDMKDIETSIKTLKDSIIL